jgi:signal transduction histidine kinase
LKIDARGAEVLSVAKHAIKRRGKKGHAANAFVPIRLKALQDLGRFSFEIYWFNRRIVEAVGELSETPTQTRAEIARWAGGPMLYRRDFRILPYGEPNNDWLALDQNAWGESGFKLNRQQVLGRVKVESKHTALGEQTNREGLVQSDAADALRTLLFWLVHTEMRGLINEADKLEKINRRVAEDAALEFRRTQLVVQEAVTDLKGALDDSQKRLAENLLTGVDLLADQCASMVKRVDKAVSEAVSEREKFVHLAGIGLMTEFIFHELNRAVEHTLGLVTTARRSQREAALHSLEAQLQTLQKRISAFDELAGERRQSKTSFDLKAAVQLVLDNHFNEFERHGIIVEFEAPTGPYPVKAVRGMVIQILENLVVNATYWLKEQARYESDFEPRIWVRLDPADKAITVEDNGPGVAVDRAEHIFQPFISSKPPDQGRGLGLFISRDMADHHDWKLYLDPETGRQRPDRSNMFVLDMGS